MDEPCDVKKKYVKHVSRSRLKQKGGFLRVPSLDGNLNRHTEEERFMEQTCSWEMGVCFWLDSSMRVHTSVRRSVLQPINKIRVLGQKSWISAFHCKDSRNRCQVFNIWRVNMRQILDQVKLSCKTVSYLLQRTVYCVWSADVEA